MNDGRIEVVAKAIWEAPGREVVTPWNELDGVIDAELKCKIRSMAKAAIAAITACELSEEKR